MNCAAIAESVCGMHFSIWADVLVQLEVDSAYFEAMLVKVSLSIGSALRSQSVCRLTKQVF